MSIAERMLALEATNKGLDDRIISLLQSINSITSPGQITDPLTVSVKTTGNDTTANPLAPGNSIPFSTISAALAWVEQHILRADVTILVDDGTYIDSINYNGLEGSRITIKALNPAASTDVYNPPDITRSAIDHYNLLKPLYNVIIQPPANTDAFNMSTGSELSIGGFFIDCDANSANSGITAKGATVNIVNNIACYKSVGNSYSFTNSTVRDNSVKTDLISIAAIKEDIVFDSLSTIEFAYSDIVCLNSSLGGLGLYKASKGRIKTITSIASINSDIGISNGSSLISNDVNIYKGGDGTGDPNVKIKNNSFMVATNYNVDSVTFGSVLCSNGSTFNADNISIYNVVGYALEAVRNSNIFIELSTAIRSIITGNGSSYGASASYGSTISLSTGNITVLADALHASNSSDIFNSASILNGDIFVSDDSNIYSNNIPITNNVSPVVPGINNSNIINTQ